MWSAPVTLTPAGSEPLSLDVVKEFLAIEADETLHDAQLGRFIAAVRGQAEAVTGTRMMPQTVRCYADQWSDLARLPIGPVDAVSAIDFYAADGTEQALLEEDYQLTGAGLMRAIEPAPGKSFPPVLRCASYPIRVTLEVGYDELPPELETAMLIMVADLFAQRESFVVGSIAVKVPTSMQVEALLGNHRIWL